MDMNNNSYKNLLIQHLEDLANDALAKQLKEHDYTNTLPKDFSGKDVVKNRDSNEVNAWQHAYISGYLSLTVPDNAALLAGYLKEFATPNQWSKDTLKDLYNNIKGVELAKNMSSVDDFAKMLYESQYEIFPDKVPSTKTPPYLIVNEFEDERIYDSTIIKNLGGLITNRSRRGRYRNNECRKWRLFRSGK
ncbi:hypothetical protein KID03_03715 [bacterium]|nr:hypothetical protein [bacterium]